MDVVDVFAAEGLVVLIWCLLEGFLVEGRGYEGLREQLVQTSSNGKNGI